MWTYNQTNYTNDYLAHHGIKGQKWGVRRFQNPDGSLTEEGKKRYSKLIDSYKAHGETGFYYDVNNLKEVKAFKKGNKQERYALLDAQSTYDMHSQAYNKNANKYAEEQTGMSFQEILKLEKSDPKKFAEKLGQYMDAGNAYRFTEEGKSLVESIVKAKTTYKEASKSYEKKAEEFCKELLGEYGDTPIPGTISIDIKTGKVSETPLNTLMAIEILRDAQRGRIDF